MKYIAHSVNSDNEEHCLKDHLFGVAERMQIADNKDSFNKILYITGLLHDFGKYQPAFQKYLKEGGIRGSVPHASWGAALAMQHKQFEAAFAIDGHHKGLPDKADLKNDSAEIISTNQINLTQ